MLTASDQYFLSYVKKTTGGGANSPPPAGIGLTTYLIKNHNYILHLKTKF